MNENDNKVTAFPPNAKNRLSFMIYTTCQGQFQVRNVDAFTKHNMAFVDMGIFRKGGKHELVIMDEVLMAMTARAADADLGIPYGDLKATSAYAVRYDNEIWHVRFGEEGKRGTRHKHLNKAMTPDEVQQHLMNWAEKTTTGMK